ncbi:hypothetical protein B0H14DRAFT_2785736 [Mycena olivaceomarginata]|nr:hypothetical protein B0H14DRAFT_2785736 [Mycena olivaceomarginata]
MSSTTTSDDSPISRPVEPLHNPAQAAHIVVPKAPLGNVVNQPAGMGLKVLRGRTVENNLNSTYISPTDSLMTPCTQMLTAAKKKHFTKSVKGIPPFASTTDERVAESDGETKPQPSHALKDLDDDNPF